jgi:DNA-binding response OmpR family regulator
VTSRIFIVDDDPDNLDILVCSISDQNYIIKSFTDPKLCLKAMENITPDLVISDVNMPGLNGFEFCKKIHEQKTTAKTPVIFLSALDVASSIIQGYDAGGTDYLTKPYRPQELVTKINKTLENCKLLDKLNQKAKSAKKIAYDAMNDAERVNIIVRFMEDCVRLNQLEPIARKIFEILHPMGLRSSMLIFCQDQDLYYSDDQLEKPLEKRLLQKIHEGLNSRMEVSGRLYEFNGRMIISYEHLSLLIRNYEEPKHSHLLDFLAGLLNGVEMKMFAVDEAMQTSTLQQQEAKHLLDQAQKSIANLHSCVHNNESRMLEVIRLTLRELSTLRTTLNLSAAEANQLSISAERILGELVTVYTTMRHLDHPVADTLNDLQDFINENLVTAQTNKPKHQ